MVGGVKDDQIKTVVQALHVTLTVELPRHHDQPVFAPEAVEQPRPRWEPARSIKVWLGQGGICDRPCDHRIEG